MSSAFRRKVYGKVKPVKKPKEAIPTRPSVIQLTADYRNIQNSPDWQTLDHLSNALLWWGEALPWFKYKYRKMWPLEASKAFHKGTEMWTLGRTASSNEEKTRYFIQALTLFRRFAAPVLKIPDIQPYLKKSKEVTKKHKEANKLIAVRFDKILTLLSQCFTSCNITLVAVPQIVDKSSGELLDRRFDHEVGKMYYSRQQCLKIKSDLYKKGLLAVAIEEAYHLSRGMAFFGEDNKPGAFLANPKEAFRRYRKLMEDVAKFAATKEAPKTLVKRERVKKAVVKG